MPMHIRMHKYILNKLYNDVHTGAFLIAFTALSWRPWGHRQTNRRQRQGVDKGWAHFEKRNAWQNSTVLN